jgi:predicted phage terminase large subunit-like protein
LFFKVRDGARFIVSPHHRVIANTLDRVSDGEIKRLIINIPPGYTKTELAVIFFVLKSLIKNPGCRFIHASYSDNLALRNSSVIRNLIQDPMFQALRPTTMTTDTRGKGRWMTNGGAEFLAASAGGQVTGFRAGHLFDKDIFTGAIIIDDPVKPADALSKVQREAINENYNNTFMSRLAHEDVPVIVIMQRVHDDDLSGYLLRGGSGEEWHHLVIPAKIPEVREEYPHKYTHGTPVHFELPPGPIWPWKHNEEELAKIKRGNSFVWTGQYLQDPSDPGSRIFHPSKWPRWSFGKGIDRLEALLWHNGETVHIDSLHVYADTAMKTGVTNDYSVFQLWAKCNNGKIYLLDQERGKWEAPELEKRAIEFFNRWQYVRSKCNLSVQSVNVEDKASGTGLIQSLNKAIARGAFGCPSITPIPRHTDKVARALAAAPAAERGDVVIPDDAPWIGEYVEEFESFNANMTHKHDDQIDPTLDAIHFGLLSNGAVDYTSIV